MSFKIIIQGLIFFIAAAMIHPHLSAQNRNHHTIAWSTPVTLPTLAGMKVQPGVAGVFAGVHNGVLLIAGGANFAGKMPWQGGEKLYRDDIYVLQKNANDQFEWVNAKTTHLKYPIAYGASTTVAEGVICIGGETGAKGISKEVFIMQWDAAEKEVLFKDLPSLPIPLANACITSMGSIIYVGGGETTGNVSDAFFMIDLKAEHPRWETLAPLPVAMSHSVALTQSNGSHPCVYVMGGRSATASGISNLHNTAFCFDPEIRQWKALHPIGDGTKATPLSAGTGVAIGMHHILLIGGDKGNLFHKIETFNVNIAKAVTEEERQKLQNERLALLDNHPGFSRDIYLYDTIEDTWRKTGELPSYVQVTTTAVKWGNDIIIPSGEIKPGIRTPKVMVGKMLPERK